MIHSIEEAAVFLDAPENLSITGYIHPSWNHFAVTDYGVQIDRMEDDTGKMLAFRNFQIFWMKVMCFEIVFSAPDPEAKTVTIDAVFTSRSGVQRITKTLPIERGRESYFGHQPQRWTPSPHFPAISVGGGAH